MKSSALNDGGAGLVYRGSMTFRRDSTGVLGFESATIAAGRMTSNGVRYHVTDHLGSVCGVVDGATGALYEASRYGAYGLRSEVFKSPSSLSEYFRGNGGIQQMRWNPYEGTRTDEGVNLSPATVFAHEADHAVSDYEDSDAHLKRTEMHLDEYTNEEEKRVVIGSEQLTVRANGEITNYQVTRRNHYGKRVKTTSPISTVLSNTIKKKSNHANTR